MAITGSKNTIGHLPVAAVAPTVQVSAAGGVAPRTLNTPVAGPRALTMAGVTVQIDLGKHTPMNIVDIINNANIPGVGAALDRYGQLVVNGVNVVAGDALLLQHLGFNA